MRRLLAALTLIFVLVATATATTPTTRVPPDARVPRLRVDVGSHYKYGTATLISISKGRAWYITNHHLTTLGSRSTYALQTPTTEYEAAYAYSNARLDLALLYAETPKDATPLELAKKLPASGEHVGIHGWSHATTFGYQAGPITATDADDIQIGVGANIGQSGGPIMHRGKVVGLVARTNGRYSWGPSIRAIRRFLGWK